jgi:S-adenosylmethionine/arginine decarboxylase-like enzyme
MPFWGFHTLLDCSGCEKPAITDPKILKAWVEALVERISMVPYGPPQIVHFGHNEVHLEGWTVIQLIETSNIIAHFNDHTGEAYIDVFSCKPYDIEDVVMTVVEFFNPTKVRRSFLTRQAD